MFSKISTLALRSRRGAIAFIIPVALSLPAVLAMTATAALAAPAPTYSGQVRASSSTDFYTDFNVKFQLEQSSANTINAFNEADAQTSKCHDCGAYAVSFQVLIATKQDLNGINETDNAYATSIHCDQCNTLAGAYQIVYAGNPLSQGQEQGLARIKTEVEDLSQTPLSEVQTRANYLANQAVTLLATGAAAMPPVTPIFVPTGVSSQIASEAVQDNQPVVRLFVKVQTPGS